MSENDTYTGVIERDLRDVRSKISEAKYRFEIGAKYEDNAEQARVYRHQADELAVAMETLERYIEAGTERGEADE